MRESAGYWIGTQPLDADRWSCAERAMVLNNLATRQALFGMHGRYVRQWNDVERDPQRSLFEHTHRVHGAKVIRADGRFVLHGQADRHTHWVLEILFRHGFREFYPWTLEHNAMRTPADMRSVLLHWSGGGREAFERWLDEEQAPPGNPTTSRSVLARIGRSLRASPPRASDTDEVRRPHGPRLGRPGGFPATDQGVVTSPARRPDLCTS